MALSRVWVPLVSFEWKSWTLICNVLIGDQAESGVTETENSFAHIADSVAQLRHYPRCPRICCFIPFEKVMNSFQGWSGHWFPKFSWCVSAFTRLAACLNCIPVPFDFFPLLHTHKLFPFLPRSANQLVSWGPSSCLSLFGILDRA